MRAAGEAWRILRRSRYRALLLACGLAVAGLILSHLLLIAANSEIILSTWFSRIPVDVYLSVPAGQEVPPRLLQLVDSLEELETLEVLSPGEAAEEFERAFGHDVTELLGENPFPHTIELAMRLGGRREVMERELDFLLQQPEVADAAYDPQLFGGIGRSLRRLGWSLLGAAVLALAGVVLIALRVLRSQVLCYKPELRLLALLGAEPWKLRLPICLAAFLEGAMPLLLVDAVTGLERWLAFRMDLNLASWGPPGLYPLAGGLLLAAIACFKSIRAVRRVYLD